MSDLDDLYKKDLFPNNKLKRYSINLKVDEAKLRTSNLVFDDKVSTADLIIREMKILEQFGIYIDLG